MPGMIDAATVSPGFTLRAAVDVGLQMLVSNGTISFGHDVLFLKNSCALVGRMPVAFSIAMSQPLSLFFADFAPMKKLVFLGVAVFRAYI